MAAIVERSRVVGVLSRVIGAFTAASATSVAWQRLAASRQRWIAEPQSGRRFAGVALIVAALVHVSISVPRPPSPGWLWLVIPLTAASAGVLLMVTARSDS